MNSGTGKSSITTKEIFIDLALWALAVAIVTLGSLIFLLAQEFVILLQEGNIEIGRLFRSLANDLKWLFARAFGFLLVCGLVSTAPFFVVRTVSRFFGLKFPIRATLYCIYGAAWGLYFLYGIVFLEGGDLGTNALSGILAVFLAGSLVMCVVDRSRSI